MSAYIMNDSDLYLIAKAVQPSNTGEFADLLKRINTKSVNHRYSEKTKVFKCKFPDFISDIPTDKEYINSLIKCWLYQSCEMENDLMFNILEDYLTNWIIENTTNNMLPLFVK